VQVADRDDARRQRPDIPIAFGTSHEALRYVSTAGHFASFMIRPPSREAQ
jgi:hypothetical protein